ncbi:YezD family protein [Paenibacillus sp. GCM10027626]|uniref:YezD family protein n=1 Tax=Paenibacillus sp. GCM10027626 TaxID=3273411 RepID=UPI00363CBCA9
MARPLKVDEIWVKRIVDEVNGLEYGSVLVTVHAGKIVQIERSERKRFDSNSVSPDSAESSSTA